MLHCCDPFKAVVALRRFMTKQLLSGKQSCNVKTTRLGFFWVRAAKGVNKGKRNTVTGCVWVLMTPPSWSRVAMLPFFAQFSRFINIMVICEIRYNVGFISFTLTEFQSCFLLNCPNLRGTNSNDRALLTETLSSACLAFHSGPQRVGREQRNRNPVYINQEETEGRWRELHFLTGSGLNKCAKTKG